MIFGMKKLSYTIKTTNKQQTTKVEAAIVSSTRASSADYKVNSEKINSAEFTGINQRKYDDWN